MSAKPKTSDARIRAVARRVLDKEGIGHLSVQAVAISGGVRAPSLYERFASKLDLLRAVTSDALRELQGCLEKSVRTASAYRKLQSMAIAYRAFAKKNPQAYKLIFAESPQ